MAMMKNIIKVLIITAFSLNLLQAKATLSIDGYMPKMLFMKVKDGGTIYVDDEKKGMTSANGPLIVQIQEGEHNVKVCFPNEKNNILRICGEQKVYVADDTQASVSIKAERSQSMTDLEKCQDGDFEICAELGDAEKDYKKAAQLYKKACDGGIMDGCNSLGIAYDDGKGVAKDVYKAAQLFQKACDGGIMDGCNSLGLAYGDGKGVAKDVYKAAQLFQKACDGGVMKGCFNLGDAYYFGNGVAKDIYKAMKLFQKACDGGVIEGCNLLQKLN